MGWSQSQETSSELAAKFGGVYCLILQLNQQRKKLKKLIFINHSKMCIKTIFTLYGLKLYQETPGYFE